MKKFLLLILSIILGYFLFWYNIWFAWDANLWGWSNLWWSSRNTRLTSEFESSNFITFSGQDYSSEWIKNTVIQIAYDLKNIFFILATIFFIVIVLKLLFANNTEEEVSKFKKWIIWISVWIIVMQLAYLFMEVTFWSSFSWLTAESIWNYIVMPLISFIETFIWALFIAIAVYSFYRLVTANWNEEIIKSWKMSIFYAIVWFIIIRFVRILVWSMYWNIYCTNWDNSCLWSVNSSGAANIIITIINWINSFLAIIIVIMIIYAWFNILLSWWDEEKVKKWKNTIIYIIIWLFILSFNYIILTFLL